MSIADPNAALASPDRVAIETPQGDIRSGSVVNTQFHADADGIERWYVVQIDGSRFRAPASEVVGP